MNGDSGIWASRPGSTMVSLRWSRNVRTSSLTASTTPVPCSPGASFEHVEEVRRVAVDAPRGQQGAVGGAGHPGEPLDPDAALPGQLEQLAELVAAGIDGGSAEHRRRRRMLEEPEVRLLVRVDVGAGEAQHVADQPAAGVAEQVQVGALGELAQQVEGVLERALAQGGVLQRQHPVVVPVGELGPLRGVAQPAEGALGVGEGAVQEDQHRLVDLQVGQLAGCAAGRPARA